MRIAIISDIHSNLPALESVLQRIRELKADAIYCLGDIVGYGPFPNETIDLVRQHCSFIVKGNHDAGVLGETDIDHFNPHGQAAIRWTRERISADGLSFLRDLPLQIIQNNLTFVHASPANPAAWTYILTLEEAVEAFKNFSTLCCFIGHTHLPITIGEDLTVNHYNKGRKHLINVGSVGQPRDRNAASAFGLFDTDESEYSLHRVPYDIKKTVKAIKAARLPSFLGKRLLQGL